MSAIDHHSARCMTRRSFVRGIGAMAVAAGSRGLFAAKPFQCPSPVLIIGDSMALCGFGKRLDQDFREAGASTVATYMACGTNPLSWTRLGNNALAKTSCGFWKIEPGEGNRTVSFVDVYGMSRGHRPGRYEVPKIEDLLARYHPQILIVQLGNNLFDALKGRQDSKQGAVLDPFIDPFLRLCMPSVKRLYWVAPPISGNIPKTIQDALVTRLRSHEGESFRVIDSRDLLTYPYRGLQPDKQHFEGSDMTLWADRVFDWIRLDLEKCPVHGGAVITESAPAPEIVTPPPVQAKADVSLVVRASLKSITTPYENKEILPYHDSMVALVYRVHRVVKGTFKGTQLVVLHPAHISEKRQPMGRFTIGQVRTLRLIPLDATPWVTLKAKDDPRFVELDRYVTEEDHRKLQNLLK
jgi:hypothetical protein